jgi:hypothetical protein
MSAYTSYTSYVKGHATSNICYISCLQEYLVVMLPLDMIFDDRSSDMLYLICDDECPLPLTLSEHVFWIVRDVVQAFMFVLEKILSVKAVFLNVR